MQKDPSQSASPGDPSLTLSFTARSPHELLGLMSRLYVLSRSIHAIAELGIANLIGAAPVPAPDVARSAGVSGDYLSRCLKFLSGYGVFEETSPNCFRATALSDLMRDDHPRSMRPVMRMVSSEWWDAAGCLPDVLRNGRSGMEQVHGRTLFGVLDEYPDLQHRFHDGMSSISQMDDDKVAQSYDFAGDGVVADLGGGEGSFLREILRRNPGRTGVLFDRPGVLAKSTLLEELVRDGRARLVPGSLFETLPAPADIYVMKGTLQGFSDGQALAILRNCASVMRPADKLLIIEPLVPLPPAGKAPHHTKTMDMVMMFLLGGKQRSLDDWSNLLSQVGLRRHRVIPTPSLHTILEVSLHPGM